ncbi:twin-arginine translocation signal domain-containing protein [Pseudomonas sp. J452]|uniref:twin-arginine translocation signal domain-containing protein n=1 Tax=Pseudomonas sp. J452 TaxID=2898441 RepID=UPI0021AE0FD6|nr:twin-arginine translocation signal domain-containing protein [Pseudomonas sp. J452]UUY09027.1 twin-arginine translocation signal domain-containing protein [Pseudomonas sp. J452]
MQRRKLLKLAGVLSAAGVCAPLLSQQASPTLGRSAGRKPNILLIATDQQRAHQDLPAAVALPGHERLLKRGVSLGNFHVNTTPSRRHARCCLLPANATVRPAERSG